MALIRSDAGFPLAALLLSGCAQPPRLLEQVSPSPGLCRATTVSASPAPAIRWYSPDRLDDYRKLWWRCLGVGPAVAWSPASDDPSPVDTLVVVSWNVHVGGAHLVQFVRELREGHLISGGPVRHFVLLLQEAYREGAVLDSPPDGFIGARRIEEHPLDGPRTDIVESARSLGLHLYYVPSMRNGTEARHREDRGNAILSTLPLTNLRAYEVAFEIQRRVSISASLMGKSTRGEPWRITVANVHLDATQVRPAMWRDLGHGRSRQTRGLAAILGSEEAIVVGGDFNTFFKNESTLRIMGQMIGRIPGSDIRPTRPPLQPDHIFARLPAPWIIEPYRRLDSRYHSDHYPLITRIVFNPS